MSNNSDINPNLISADAIKPASLELETVRKKNTESARTVARKLEERGVP